MPTFITQALPEWFAYLFMVVLLAAAMSTLSGLFHAICTSIGLDFYQQAIAKGKHQERTVPLAKAGILVAFVVTTILAYNLGPGIVAIATALFFGMCAATFLPAYISALFWPRATRTGVITGMLTGISVWALWVLFFHEKESAALLLCSSIFGKTSLVAGSIWATVDPIVIALPASALVTLVGCLLTKPAPVTAPALSSKQMN
jgi:solute:Na+ symporter, SSS family